jgi:serine/threonine protein kinase
LNGEEYGTASDWWAFGVIVYEMVCGRSPFKGETLADSMKSIVSTDVSKLSGPLMPGRLNGDKGRPPASKQELDHVRDMVSRLLMKHPDQRLGSGTRGGEEVMKHNFFIKGKIAEGRRGSLGTQTPAAASRSLSPRVSGEQQESPSAAAAAAAPQVNPDLWSWDDLLKKKIRPPDLKRSSLLQKESVINLIAAADEKARKEEEEEGNDNELEASVSLEEIEANQLPTV